MSRTPTNLSNPAIASPTGELEHILCKEVLSYCTACFHKDPGQVKDEEHEPMHILDKAFKLIDFNGPYQSPTLRLELAPGAVYLEIEFNPHIRNYVQRTVAHKVSRKFVEDLSKQDRKTSTTPSQICL